MDKPGTAQTVLSAGFYNGIAAWGDSNLTASI